MKIPWCTQIILILGLAALSTVSDAIAQRRPIAAGDLVRFANVDSASNNLWATGRVASLRGDSLLLADRNLPSLVRLNESIRLQVSRGRNRKTAVGGTAGLFAGGIFGALSMDVEGSSSRTNQASFGPIIQYAALGALVGAVVGSRFGPRNWIDVPLGQRSSLAETLPVAAIDLASVVDVDWWTQLESESIDIAAILDLHSDNLAPIEGIWEPLHEPIRVAIVRESRYAGIDYVAYAPSGQVVGAVNGPGTDDRYHIRFPPGTTQYPAALTDSVLTLRAPDDVIQQWVKRSQSVDSTFLALSRGVTLLSPVVIEAPRVNERLRDVGFTQRMQALSGTFITREEIVRQNPRNTAELLRRIPGFTVTPSGDVRAPRESLCSGVVYYVDGVHAEGSQISFVLPMAVAGMEVYTSAAAVPIQYQVTGNPRCGVILIWTVDGGRTP